MSLRSISPDLDPRAVASVDHILDEIVQSHGVRIGLAVESGSRAWGFPSPDSDYDGRFIYVRPARDALTIWPRRDVIETPLVGDMDVNGWDLAKALRLLLKGNAVVVEWLQSPIVYRGEPWFRDDLLAFADRWLDRGAVARHYLHLGQRQKVLHLDGQAEVPLKKIFYALRPAVALRWLRMHPDDAVAPMHFPSLVSEADLPAEVAAIVSDLIARKAVTREMGDGQIPSSIRALLDVEFAAAADMAAVAPSASREAKAAADSLFAAITLRFDQQQA